LKENELISVLRLLNTQNIGVTGVKKLIAKVGSAEEVFKEKKTTLLKIPGVGTHMLEYLHDKSNKLRAEEELSYIHDKGIDYTYFLDSDFPQDLLNCFDGPVLLFKKGIISYDTPRVISVVGTRNMTPYGRDFCKQLIKDLSTYNPIIVSGYAYGVDICAHKAAIDNNLQTVGVLAHGFSRIYPRSHARYMEEVMGNGGFLSEFFYKEEPLREHFLQRNRIVAGISKATIVIESANKGGALVTADIANSYNRDVFAVPGKSTDLFSEGCNNLIKNHKAHLLTSAEDVVKHLNWDMEKKIQKPIQKELFITFTPQEQQVFEYLKDKGQELLDVIAIETQIPAYHLVTILLQLELKGVVKPLPGKQFTTIL